MLIATRGTVPWTATNALSLGGFPMLPYHTKPTNNTTAEQILTERFIIVALGIEALTPFFGSPRLNRY